MIQNKSVEAKSQLNEIYKLKGKKDYLYINIEETKINKQLNNEFADQINVVKELIFQSGRDKELLILKDKLKKNKFNLSVKTTQEAINMIKRHNLFEYFNLNATKDNKMKLEYPIRYKYFQVLANNEDEVKRILDIDNKNDTVLIKNNYINIYEVYKVCESIYSVIYSKTSKEYNIAIFNNKDDKYYIRFNFIDLYSMLFSLNKEEAINEILNLLEIEILDVKKLKDMYKKNIESINYKIKDYPQLNKLIKKHIPILIEMINISTKRCNFYSENQPIGKIPIPTRELAKIVEKNYNTIIPYLNGFCVLGFCNKEELYLKDDFGYKNNIAIYEFYPFTIELLEYAEEIAKKLKDNRINLSKVTYYNIIKVLGKETADKVIIDKNILTRVNSYGIYS